MVMIIIITTVTVCGLTDGGGLCFNCTRRTFCTENKIISYRFNGGHVRPEEKKRKAILSGVGVKTDRIQENGNVRIRGTVTNNSDN